MVRHPKLIVENTGYPFLDEMIVVMFSEVGDTTKKALEDEVVEKWQHFTKNGKIIYDQRIVEISASK